MIQRSRAAVARVACALGGVLLASCAPTVNYVPPAPEDSARLSVRADIAPGMGFAVFAFDEAHACQGPRPIARGTAESAVPAVLLRAGPLASLEFAVAQSRRFCGYVFSFYPERGRSYVLVVKGTADGCTVRLLDATDPDHPVTERTYIRRARRADGTCTARRPEQIARQMAPPGPEGAHVHDPHELDDFDALLPR